MRQVRLAAEVHEQLTARADAEHGSPSDIIRAALRSEVLRRCLGLHSVEMQLVKRDQRCLAQGCRGKTPTLGPFSHPLTHAARLQVAPDDRLKSDHANDLAVLIHDDARHAASELVRFQSLTDDLGLALVAEELLAS